MIFEETDPLALVYLACSLGMVVLWSAAYWRIPQLRRELVWLGIASLPHAILLEVLLWTKDWWRPPSLLNMNPSITDFIYAFFNNGFIAALYTGVLYVLFRGRLVAVATPPPLAYRLLPWIVITVLPFPLVWIGGVQSSWATFVATLVGLRLMLWLRPDLLGMALDSGLAGFLSGVATFVVLKPFFPDFVERYWVLDKISDLYRVLPGPLEDLLWYGYTAAFFGIYYKFWHGLRVEFAATRFGPRPHEL